MQTSGIPPSIKGLNSGSLDSGIKEAKSSTEPNAFKALLESQKAEDAKIAENLAPPKTKVLTFSQHAAERMSQRGIVISPEEMTKAENAVSSALKKGSNNTLVLGDDFAMIVSAKNNKVITVMEKASMKENVFTNIDSTVFI